MHSRIWFATGLVAAGLTLAGCAGTGSAGPPTPVRLTDAASALLAEEGSYAADEVVLHRADEELIRRCMTAHGMRYVSRPYAPGSAGSVTDDEEHPDMVWRRAVGYSLGMAAGRARDGNERHLATLSPAGRAEWERTLRGDGTRTVTLRAASGRAFTAPVDGCVAAAARRLYGTSEQAGRALYLAQDVRFGWQPRVRRDPEYVAATGRWAACMRRHGQPFATPAAARAAMAARYRVAASPAPIEALERSVAVTDGRCVVEAGLGTASGHAVRRLTGMLTDETRLELNAAAAARLRGVAAAGTVLAGR